MTTFLPVFSDNEDNVKRINKLKILSQFKLLYSVLRQNKLLKKNFFLVIVKFICSTLTIKGAKKSQTIPPSIDRHFKIVMAFLFGYCLHA